MSNDPVQMTYIICRLTYILLFQRVFPAVHPGNHGPSGLIRIKRKESRNIKWPQKRYQLLTSVMKPSCNPGVMDYWPFKFVIMDRRTMVDSYAKPVR